MDGVFLARPSRVPDDGVRLAVKGPRTSRLTNGVTVDGRRPLNTCKPRMEVSRVPLYEVLLLRDDDKETRLTDQALRVGEAVSIGEERWLVQGEAAPERPDAKTRYICVPAAVTE